MNEEARVTTAEPATVDTAKLIVAIALAVAGVVAYYVLTDQPTWMRWVVMAGGFLLGLGVFAWSQYGSNFWQFALDSRIELRKVFWPTRQETLNTTMIVFAFVVITALFFWVLDLILASVTRYFTGQGA
jgi:preprotein translocase subunit SecE